VEVQTKQIRINIHKRNNTKTQYKQYKNTVQTVQNTVNTSTHITKTPTHYKTHTHTHTHITQHTHTHTHILQNPHIHTPTHYKTSSNNHSTRYTPNETVTVQLRTLSIRSPYCVLYMVRQPYRASVSWWLRRVSLKRWSFWEWFIPCGRNIFPRRFG
jgi:hypothetical protein